MRRILVVAVSVAAMLASSGLAVANGNKNGWVDHPNGPTPKGLVVSGENGRVDNGKGNGGENPGGQTPNAQGEDGTCDADPQNDPCP